MSIIPYEEKLQTFSAFMSDPRRIKAIQAAAPKHLNPERLLKVARNAVTRNPSLLECDMMTIYASIVQAAELGLEVGSALGEAHLVPFYNKKTKQKECQLIPDYKGYISLMYRSGFVKAVEAHAVYKGDVFDVRWGTERKIIHVPSFDNEAPENLTHAYVVFDMISGGLVTDVMSRSQIDRIKGMSAAGGYGPWVDHYAAMGVKSVIRRGSKQVPRTAELGKILALDDAHDTGDYSALEFDVPALEAPAVPRSAVQKLNDKVQSRAADAPSMEELDLDHDGGGELDEDTETNRGR